MFNTKHILKMARREDGAITVYSLFLTITLICVGGLALDVANALMTKTHLQIAADSAAHAALVARDRDRTEAQAKAIAVGVAQASLPASHYVDTIRDTDIFFGTWDSATQTFTPVAGSDDAVLVNTQRLAARGNSMVTYFLRFAGMWEMDVVRQSVFETYRPTCMLEGLVAEQRIDTQSGNTYTAGFCIHTNDHIEMNNGNTLENGVIVSMPYETDIVTPNSNGGWGNNTGLSRAVRSGSYRIQILSGMDDIIAEFDDNTSEYYNSDFLSHPVKDTNFTGGVTLDASNRQAGEVRRINCGTLAGLSGPITNVVHTAAGANGNGNSGNNGNGNSGGGTGGGNSNTVVIGDGVTNGVIYTDCLIDIQTKLVLEDLMIISENTDDFSIQGRADNILGRIDNCLPGGGIQIVTKGGVKFANGVLLHGSKIIAMGPVEFSANAGSMHGASIITNDEIDFTSNAIMGFCNGAGMEHAYEAEYFRLAH